MRCAHSGPDSAVCTPSAEGDELAVQLILKKGLSQKWLDCRYDVVKQAGTCPLSVQYIFASRTASYLYNNSLMTLSTETSPKLLKFSSLALAAQA